MLICRLTQRQMKFSGRLVLKDTFPSDLVKLAYLNPDVDLSKESFEWGEPDIIRLRRFGREKLGWSLEFVEQQLEQVLNSFTERVKVRVNQKKCRKYGILIPLYLGNCRITCWTN